MFFTRATIAGSETPNEDWSAATPDLIVVLDGATIRTETGCAHGAAWYTRKLGTAILTRAAARATPLNEVLADAIREVADSHPECDLSHPGTPSAGVAVVRLEDAALHYLVLGDVTVVLEIGADGVVAISDQRISASAAEQRAEVDRYPIGSGEKNAALVVMKHAELAARNRPGGYWIAAADPLAARHAITGSHAIETVRRFAALTDGAARWVDLFQAGTWDSAMRVLATCGPEWLIEKLIRSIEVADPLGIRYPRNKTSDDATAVFAELVKPDPTRSTVSQAAMDAAVEELRQRLNDPTIYGDGLLIRSR